MVTQIKCNPGNKPCGKRCVPEQYECAADKTSNQMLDAGQEISEAQTRKGKKSAQVTRKFAREKLEAQEMEAQKLAGGEEAYKEELDKMLKDTGAGIDAVIIRNTMRTLAPNLIRADDVAFYLSTKKKGKYEKQIVNPDRKAFKMSDMVRKGDKLKKGDVIRVRAASDKIAGGSFYHYAVYLGNGRIIHYNPIRRQKGKKMQETGYAGVHETHLKDHNTATRYKWEKTGVSSKYSPEELEARIKKVRDKKIKFNIMSNNCEHFAHLLTQGKAYSSQTDVSTGVAARITQLFMYHYQHNVLRKKGGLGDRKYARDFLTQNELEFSERVSGRRKVGNEYTPKFRYPRNEEEIMLELTKAMQFAETVSKGDVSVQTGILAGWLRTYITNLSIKPSK